MARGHSDKEIAFLTGVSHGYVANCLGRIYKKRGMTARNVNNKVMLTLQVLSERYE